MTEEPTSHVGPEIAAAVRAEMGRQGMRNATLASRLGRSEMWVSRRVRMDPPASMTIADLEAIAAALGVPVTQLLPTAEPTGDGHRS